MPGPVRKILIFAAVDGLILQPLAPRGQRPATACKISYKDHSILPVAKYGYDSTASESNFEAFGIIGKMLELYSTWGLSWGLSTISPPIQNPELPTMLKLCR